MAKKTYSDRLEALKKRRIDTELIEKRAMFDTSFRSYLTESYERLQESESVKYLLGAMQQVDKIYTDNTYSEAERVQNQLDKIKDSELSFEYRYQGSVSNNTHIRAHSDIDILVLIEKFFTLEPPQTPKYPYKGDPMADLALLRSRCEKHLTSAFYSADVDCSGAKSITLSGGSLRRKIDVVPSNWYDTLKYSETKDEVYRGVQVFDKKENRRILNTPFYHNYLLEKKDLRCLNNYKKVVRLLKTLKADADIDITFSSYDIAAIVYTMDDNKFHVGGKHLLLLKSIKEHIETVLSSNIMIDNLKVPDGSRKIFDTTNKVLGLKNLKAEIDSLYNDITRELIQSGILLESKSFAV